MRQKSETPVHSSEQVVKDIRRATRKQYSAEEKIRIVLDGLRGEYSIAELCRREGIAESLYEISATAPLAPVLRGVARLADKRRWRGARRGYNWDSISYDDSAAQPGDLGIVGPGHHFGAAHRAHAPVRRGASGG